jgi:hypothetical protein
MVERGGRTRLADESLEGVGLKLRSLRKDLEYELTLEKGIACAIDFPHAARADAGYDFVAIDGTAGFKRVSLRHFSKQK